MQTLNANFDLIIFDCDGVLVDSEVISCRVHAEVLTRHGYPITAEQVRQRFLGRTSVDATHFGKSIAAIAAATWVIGCRSLA